jgi:hypothetical protein
MFWGPKIRRPLFLWEGVFEKKKNSPYVWANTAETAWRTSSNSVVKTNKGQYEHHELPQKCRDDIQLPATPFGESIHSSMALQPYVGPWHLLQFRNLFYTVGRTPWTSDQPVARPGQHKHRINAHTNIHALSGIRIHDPSVVEGEDNSCLKTARPPWSAFLENILANFCTKLCNLYLKFFNHRQQMQEHKTSSLANLQKKKIDAHELWRHWC